MLSDEEKKAYNLLRYERLESFDIQYENALKILYLLIEKQSKEIEELKEKNNNLANIKLSEWQDDLTNAISKDKIRAKKIEELEKEQEKEAIEILNDTIKSLEGHTPFRHTNYKKVQAIETVLKELELKDKEIEELKNAETYKIAIIDKDKYISKHKIKAKIEEIGKIEAHKIKAGKILSREEYNRAEFAIESLVELMEE